MEIKMEKSSGVSARIPALMVNNDLVKTGSVTSSEKQNITVSKMGMESFLSNPKIKKDKRIEIDNSMLSILKVNDPLLPRDGHSVWGCLYEETPKKRCVAMFHAAFFV